RGYVVVARPLPRTGLDVEVREVGILDPEDPAQARPGELVLAIGAGGRAALPALRAAGAARAAAVAIKLECGTGGRAAPGTAPARGFRRYAARPDAAGRATGRFDRPAFGHSLGRVHPGGVPGHITGCEISQPPEPPL
ncbi:hypothetical protein ACWGCW_34965, partial [Streptomyces sp. NPDC054933]